MLFTFDSFITLPILLQQITMEPKSLKVTAKGNILLVSYIMAGYVLLRDPERNSLDYYS